MADAHGHLLAMELKDSIDVLDAFQNDINHNHHGGWAIFAIDEVYSNSITKMAESNMNHQRMNHRTFGNCGNSLYLL